MFDTLIANPGRLRILTALAVENRQARPEKYALRQNVQATAASRTMVVSGLILLCFVILRDCDIDDGPGGYGRGEKD